MLRTHPRVVETCRDTLGTQDLSVRILQHVGEGSMQDPRVPVGQGGRSTGVPARTSCLDAEQFHR